VEILFDFLSTISYGLFMDLKKPTSTIEISNDLSLVQRMAYAVILKHYHSAPKPSKGGFRCVSVPDLCKAMGYVKKDFFYLDDQLLKLQKTTIQWLGDKKGEFKRVNFFSYTELKDGIFYYDFHPVLERHIADKKNSFNLLELGSMRLLKKKHSIALYEIVAGFRPNPKSGYNSGTAFHDVDYWRKLLTGSSETYPDYKDFNRYILKQAMLEINAKTDLSISMVSHKIKRAVCRIKFEVSDNVSYDRRANKASRVVSAPVGYVEAPYVEPNFVNAADNFAEANDIWNSLDD
jgi:plasmid replication initiation protein